jgi:hypothetical protein
MIHRNDYCLEAGIDYFEAGRLICGCLGEQWNDLLDVMNLGRPRGSCEILGEGDTE